MNELTLESLAKRVEALEEQFLADKRDQPKGGWETVAGMFEGDETMRQIIEEGAKIREAEREAARRGVAEE